MKCLNYLSPIFTFEVMYMPTIKPKRPMALPKISTIKILTNKEELAASANAAPEPTTPTAIPQNRFTRPTLMPAAKIKYPAIQF